MNRNDLFKSFNEIDDDILKRSESAVSNKKYPAPLSRLLNLRVAIVSFFSANKLKYIMCILLVMIMCIWIVESDFHNKDNTPDYPYSDTDGFNKDNSTNNTGTCLIIPHIDNLDDYEQYISDHNMLNNFVSYQDIESFGKFEGISVISKYSYLYKLIDTNDCVVRLKVDHTSGLSNELFEYHILDENEIDFSDMRNSKNTDNEWDYINSVWHPCVYYYSEDIAYVYQNGDLIYISWYSDDILYHLYAANWSLEPNCITSKFLCIDNGPVDFNSLIKQQNS